MEKLVFELKNKQSSIDELNISLETECAQTAQLQQDKSAMEHKYDESMQSWTNQKDTLTNQV